MISRYIDIERLIHSLKTAIACILGFLLTKIIGFAADQWIIVTILVVMCAQIYVGSVVQKAYLRFIGTLAGSLVAALALTVAGHTGFVVAITLGISSFVFSYIATGQENLTYAGTLGAVTTAIILMGTNPSLLFASQRFLEISIGIFIAAFVSQFVLPIHASTHLRRTQANTLDQLRQYYINCMVNPKHESEDESQELDENIIKSLSKQRQLVKDAQRELLNKFYRPEHVIQTLQCEKEILRCIDFMHNAFHHLHKTEAVFIRSEAFKNFNNAIIQCFQTLIKKIERNDSEHIHLPSLADLKSDVQENIALIPYEESLYIDGLLFSADMLVTQLTTLSNLYRTPVYESPTRPLTT